MTEIYIISGFLGAGKTTLIQKLLTEAFQGKKVALVENDFGEVNVDAALLKGSGYLVKELNAGCICCTLAGDFIAALASLLKDHCPEIVLIEPSGVGKLSDVEKALQNRSIAPVARIARKITVIDVKRCRSYLENFGEFFEDQVAHADTILFSRAEAFPEKVQEGMEIVRRINPQARVSAEKWNALPASRLLGNGKSGPVENPRQTPEENAGCGCPGHHHGPGCHCGHPHHTAEDSFDTLTIHFTHPVLIPELTARLSELKAPYYGKILRAKGIVKSQKGFFNLQYLPGDLKIEETEGSGNALCIIGKDLDRPHISALFAHV